jgi:hypothetical protein
MLTVHNQTARHKIKRHAKQQTVELIAQDLCEHSGAMNDTFTISDLPQ